RVNRPADARSIAPHRWRRVDLPQPDGPMNATKSPASTESETPARARTGGSPPREVFSRFSAISIGKVVRCRESGVGSVVGTRYSVLSGSWLGAHPQAV